MCEFLISENNFLISENQFFWYQKLFSDIGKCHDFLISEIIFGYQKMISDIRQSWHFLISGNNFWYQKLFLISENRGIFRYQKIISDIRKIDFLISENYFLISKIHTFPLVFAKINRYFIMFVVLESKLGQSPSHASWRCDRMSDSTAIFRQAGLAEVTDRIRNQVLVNRLTATSSKITKISWWEMLVNYQLNWCWLSW